MSKADQVKGIADTIKHLRSLDDSRIELFLLCLVRQAQDKNNFQEHPLPWAATREFVCKVFWKGQP